MTEIPSTIHRLFVGIADFFTVKLIPAFVIPVFGVFFGFNNTLVLRAMLFLIVFDFVTGIIAAYVRNEEIKSKKVVRSAFKVAIYGLLISAGYLTEQITPGNTYIESAVITFLALTELISIIENAGKMGYAIPKKLLRTLEKWRDDEDILPVPDAIIAADNETKI